MPKWRILAPKTILVSSDSGLIIKAAADHSDSISTSIQELSLGNIVIEKERMPNPNLAQVMQSDSYLASEGNSQWVLFE